MFEALRCLLAEAICIRRKKNLVQVCSFEALLDESIEACVTKSLSTFEVVQNLIVLVKQMCDGYLRGSELHLLGDEGAFYGGLADDERARLVAGDAPQVSCSCRIYPLCPYGTLCGNKASCALLQGAFLACQ